CVKNSWFAYLAGRSNGVSDSSVQMPWRSGSPQAVFNEAAGTSLAIVTCAGLSHINADNAAKDSPSDVTNRLSPYFLPKARHRRPEIFRCRQAPQPTIGVIIAND